jgi:glycosyltransferase involved in cell wall biosynthesis
MVLVNPDWFFLSHFVERALAARHAGFDVSVMCSDTGSGRQIEELGLRLIPVCMSRHGLAPIEQLRTLWQVHQEYKRRRPSLVWQIGLKPIVLGTLAAKFAGVNKVVNAPVGMGFVFASDSLKARLLRPFGLWALRYLLNPRRSKVVFENKDDLRELIDIGAVRSDDAILIRGAGVDLQKYQPTPEPEGLPVVLFAARLIWEKGIGVFIDAARLLHAQNVEARFLVAGGVDHGSSSAVSELQMRAWEAECAITWLGARRDMAHVIAGCNLFCLPTYREGLPKVLLEAMACGRACVATDVPGCREAIRDGDNGLLVPARDAEALARAIRHLLERPELRRKMGIRGRERAEMEFAREKVNAETLEVFQALLREPD